MSIETARESARESNGRFGPQQHTESEICLLKPVSMRTAQGIPVQITPGQVDEAAEHLYTNGQCLAYAVALARRNSWGVAVLTYDEEGLVGHAWAVDPDGVLVDINGRQDADRIEDQLAHDEILEHYRSDEIDYAVQDHAEKIGPQDYELAATMLG